MVTRASEMERRASEMEGRASEMQGRASEMQGRASEKDRIIKRTKDKRQKTKDVSTIQLS